MVLAQEDLDILLITAIKRNDAQGVILALKEGANPNAIDDIALTEPPGLVKAYQILDPQYQFFSVPALQLLFSWRLAANGNIVWPPENLLILNTLLDAGADINAQSTFLESPLYLATAQNKLATVRTLLARGANPNLPKAGGNTPIMAASWRRPHGYLEFIRILLQYNADINQQNDHGVTALMIATLHGNSDTVRLLIQRGAKIDLQDTTGYTALTLARESKPEMVPVLEKALGATTVVRKQSARSKRKRHS